MVFLAAVARNGKVMPLLFIEARLKINTGEQFNILVDVLLLWIREKYDPNKVLVKYSTLVHGTEKIQTCLKENLPMFVTKDIWPSS